MTETKPHLYVKLVFMELDKAYNPQETESRIYKLWEKTGCFNPDKLKGKKSYAIHLPPPNVTGSLHMGHALNATLSDILIRYHRMKGEKTVWFPGTDHAGIATQRAVEKQLRKEGKSRWDLGREKFIERVWQWRKEYGDIIIGQLKKLGASCDWSRLRFTMDDDYAQQVKEVFVHYYKKGWIYRGTKVVSWCPRCQTSLSDLEIEYREEKSRLWYIRYPIKEMDSRLRGNDKKRYIVVATTRPETMLGDTAVAVNPKDKRYKGLIGGTVVLPIQNKEIPIITDKAVEMDFGTGAVKVTPAHDLLDAEVGERHKLETIQVINERGEMTKEAGALYEGLKAKECREKVVVKLEKLKLIQKIEDYTHNLSICYRCNAEIQPILSKQWFLKMDKLAEKALEAVKSGKTKITPKRFEKIYFAWMKNIRDWTISRQIWWGHRLPVWFCQNQTGVTSDQLPVTNDKKGGGFIVALKKSTKCQFCKKCEMKQSEDVLDTWFSSALWPFAGLSKKDIKDFYPSNVLITARDIINLWVARMIFSGLELMGKAPFPETLIHATILNKEGRRMSKSLGTGIDPVELIEKYGADATRFGIIWQTMGNQDIHWDETAVVAGKKFANKLWNVTRYVILNVNEGSLKDSSLPPAEGEARPDGRQNDNDKLILKKLNQTKKSVEKHIAKYEFGQALHQIYDFVWHDFADKYIEQSKQQKNEEVLAYCLWSIIKMTHPFMPFVTEEICQKITNKKGLLIVEKW
ncbi:MAG: valine--tRNA ligase [Patescibacteria group bacterium]